MLAPVHFYKINDVQTGLSDNSLAVELCQYQITELFDQSFHILFSFCTESILSNSSYTITGSDRIVIIFRCCTRKTNVEKCPSAAALQFLN